MKAEKKEIDPESIDTSILLPKTLPGAVERHDVDPIIKKKRNLLVHHHLVLPPHEAAPAPFSFPTSLAVPYFPSFFTVGLIAFLIILNSLQVRNYFLFTFKLSLE